MIYRNECTLPKEYLEQLNELRLEGLPALVQTLVNQAIQIEQEKFSQAKPYQRAIERKGLASSHKPKTVKMGIGKNLYKHRKWLVYFQSNIEENCNPFYRKTDTQSLG